MTAASVLLHDLRLQYRHGFYAAYLFVSASYVLLLRALPPEVRVTAFAPLMLSETSVIGFFFGGALLQLERADGTLSALAVTPLQPAKYLLSKATSLAALAVMAALAIGWGALGSISDPPLLAAAAGLTAAGFAALGIAVASRLDTLDRFVVRGGLLTSLLGLPVLPYLGVADSPLWTLAPTYPAVRLMGAATGRGLPAGSLPAWISVGLLVAWAAAAMLLARRWLVRFGLGRSAVGR